MADLKIDRRGSISMERENQIPTSGHRIAATDGAAVSVRGQMGTAQSGDPIPHRTAKGLVGGRHLEPTSAQDPVGPEGGGDSIPHRTADHRIEGRHLVRTSAQDLAGRVKSDRPKKGRMAEVQTRGRSLITGWALRLEITPGDRRNLRRRRNRLP